MAALLRGFRGLSLSFVGVTLAASSIFACSSTPPENETTPGSGGMSSGGAATGGSSAASGMGVGGTGAGGAGAGGTTAVGGTGTAGAGMGGGPSGGTGAGGSGGSSPTGGVGGSPVVPPLDCGGKGAVIENHGPPANRVNYVIVGDGYTEAELETTYLEHIQTYMTKRFSDPIGQVYLRYRNFVNICAIKVPS